MANVTIWSKVKVYLNSVNATKKAITALTLANPAVATSTGHGLSDGDVIKLVDVAGIDIDENVYEVQNTTTNTFEIKGLDTTGSQPFVSGNFESVTFTKEMRTAVDVSANGGSYSDIDLTTIHDGVSKTVPGIAEALTYEMTHLWDPTDAALEEMKKASDKKEKRVFKFLFSNGKKMYISGYVGAQLLPTGSAQDRVETTTKISSTSTFPTYY